MSERPGLLSRWRSRYEAACRFLKQDVWTLTPTRKLHRFLLELLRTGILVVEGFVRSDLLMLSKALTYKVAFALVPLLAVMLAIFQGFGGLSKLGQQVKEFVLQNMDPSKGGEFARYIDRIVAQVNAPAIGIIGFLLLVYIAFSLMYTVEAAFNRIWGIRRPRPLLRRLTVYWTLLTLGPLFLAVSLAVTTFVQNHHLMKALQAAVPDLNTIFLNGASYLFSWLVFASLYLFMPNTRVKIGAALIGAVIAGTLWVWTKDVWVWYNTRLVARYQVYGSLGAVPVFLLWVYVSWILVLLGAEIAFAAQHVRTYRRELETPNVSQRFKERLALLITLQATRAFIEGRKAPDADELAEGTRTPVRLVHEILEKLTSADVLREVLRRNEKSPGYVPGRDPRELKLQNVLDAMHAAGSDPFILPNGRETARLDEILNRARARASESLDRVSLRDLVDRPEPEKPPPRS